MRSYGMMLFVVAGVFLVGVGCGILFEHATKLFFVMCCLYGGVIGGFWIGDKVNDDQPDLW